MNTHVKRQIAFVLSMGVVTTGIISFVILAMNLGFSEGFTRAWLRSWATGYAIVIPMMLVIGPRLKVQVNRRIH